MYSFNMNAFFCYRKTFDIGQFKKNREISGSFLFLPGSSRCSRVIFFLAIFKLHQDRDVSFFFARFKLHQDRRVSFFLPVSSIIKIVTSHLFFCCCQIKASSRSSVHFFKFKLHFICWIYDTELCLYVSFDEHHGVRKCTKFPMILTYHSAPLYLSACR